MMRSTLIVLLIVLPPMVVAAVMRTQETPKRFAEVEQGRLYRGAFPTAKQIRYIHKHDNIRTIVSLTTDEGKARDLELDGAVKALDLKRFRYPLSGDGTGDLATLDRAADTLADTQNQPIFFHCSAGDKRCSSVLGAYWMKHKHKSLRQTLDDLTRDYGMEFDGEDRELAKFLSKYAVYIGVKTEPTTQPAES
jgi:protein tyrosine/serine phosphatase